MTAAGGATAAGTGRPGPVPASPLPVSQLTPEPLGTCCIVLHSHLPWLAHAGSWPVGKEWLYQAWAASYLPLADTTSRWIVYCTEGYTSSLAAAALVSLGLDATDVVGGIHGWRAAGLAAEAIASRWTESDAGIWEIDDQPWTTAG